MRRQAIVVGAGAYVLGDRYGLGVVLPTLLDEQRAGRLDHVHVAVRTPRADDYHQRLRAIGDALALRPQVHEHVYGSLAALEELPLDDAVAFVAVPDAHHAELVRFFLERDVPVWVVKPLTGDGERSRALDLLARTRDVPLWVDYHKRFDPSNRKLASLVASGELGRMLSFAVQYSQPWDLPLGDLAAWAGDVDVFQYIGCHYVDLLLHLFPAAVPTRVSATGLVGRLSEAGGPEHDVVHALLDLALDDRHVLRADLTVGWNDPTGAPAKSHQRVECTFTHGRVVADQKERGFEVWSDARTDQVNPYFFQLLPDPADGRPRATGYGPESLRRFLEAVEDPRLRESRGLPWSASAWRTDRVVDLVRESVAGGGAWVEATRADFERA